MACLNLFNMIYANEIVDEYETNNCNIILEEIEYRNLYKVSVYDLNKNQIKSLEPFNCYNRPWIRYLGKNYFSIFGGSFQAPDCFCYVYDANKNLFSEKIYLPICFDISNDLVLTAKDEITVFKIFNPDEKTVITPPDDICNFIQLWDRIRINDTKMDDGNLYLAYNVFKDSGRLDTYGRTEVYSLDTLLSTNDIGTEIIQETISYKKTKSVNGFLLVIVFLVGSVIGYLLHKIKGRLLNN